MSNEGMTVCSTSTGTHIHCILMNKSALTVSLCIYPCSYVRISIECIFKMGFLDHRICICRGSVNTAIQFFLVIVVMYTTSKSNVWKFQLFHILAIINLFNFNYSGECMLIFHCGFNMHASVDAKHTVISSLNI